MSSQPSPRTCISSIARSILGASAQSYRLVWPVWWTKTALTVPVYTASSRTMPSSACHCARLTMAGRGAAVGSTGFAAARSGPTNRTGASRNTRKASGTTMAHTTVRRSHIGPPCALTSHVAGTRRPIG